MKKILVATDGSMGAQVAADWGADLAAAVGAKVVLATVIEPGEESTTSSDALSEFRREVTSSLESEWAAPFVDADVDLELRVLQGDARTAVLDAVVGSDIDAVVLGTSGRNDFQGPGVGSVTHYLARRLPCPTIAVPKAGGPLREGTVVVGVDGATANRSALDWAAATTAQLGGHGLAVHVYSPLSDVMTHTASNWQYPWEARVLGEVRRTDFELVPIAGRPVEDLVAQASATDASMIVVGRRGLGSVHGLLLGRVPARLLHRSDRPIAIVPH